jgi:outer membrane murein-binding lipoprotein Lpp
MTPPRVLSKATGWLDIKIPLWGIVTLIIGLLAQSGSLLLWGARIEAKLNENTASIADLETKSQATQRLSETTARVDERTQALTITVNRIADRIDAKGGL